nr:winged helix DNA-binding domain-containing protein [Arthrobacter crystallopoietes]
MPRRRLLAQQLWGPGAADAPAAVRNLLAVQAQEYAYARWSLAQRCSGATRDDAAAVDAAIADGTILRTHVLRPTWHFVHRQDLRWLSTLSRPRLKAGNKTRDRQLGIDPAIVERSNAVLAEVVAGGRHVPREDLAAALERAGLLEDTGERLNGAPLRNQRLAHLVYHAEMDQMLVSGVPQATNGGAARQTYAAFDERVPPLPHPFDRDEALAALVRRYFSSHGPATVKDCALWSGLTQADVRRGLEAAGTGTGAAVLQTGAVDGHEFLWADDGGPSLRGPGSPRVDLIQCYDEYVMGYTPTRGYLGGSAPAPANAKVPSHVVLLNGRMTGNWQHALKPGTAVVRVLLHRTLAADEEQALMAALERYRSFLGRPLDTEISVRGASGQAGQPAGL